MRKHRTGKLSASFNIECYILTMKFFIFTDMVINLSEVESIADVQGSSSVLFFRSGRQVVLSDKARQDIGAALKGNGMTIPSSATS